MTHKTSSMKLHVLLGGGEHSCPPSPAPKPAICVRAGGRLLPDRSQASAGDKPAGSLGPEGTKVHNHPPLQGKLRGKGKPILPLWFLREQKQSQSQKEREPQTLPAAADEQSHFGKYLSKTKTKQKPKKMVV